MFTAVKFIPLEKIRTTVAFLLMLSSSFAFSESLPWYLNKPTSLQTAAAINALSLVQSKAGEPIVVAVIDSGVVADHLGDGAAGDELVGERAAHLPGKVGAALGLDGEDANEVVLELDHGARGPEIGIMGNQCDSTSS